MFSFHLNLILISKNSCLRFMTTFNLWRYLTFSECSIQLSYQIFVCFFFFVYITTMFSGKKQWSKSYVQQLYRSDILSSWCIVFILVKVSSQTFYAHLFEYICMVNDFMQHRIARKQFWVGGFRFCSNFATLCKKTYWSHIILYHLCTLTMITYENTFDNH